MGSHHGLTWMRNGTQFDANESRFESGIGFASDVALKQAPNATPDHDVKLALTLCNYFEFAHGSLWCGFLAAFLVIFVVEIGDKTFFLAALLAMKYSRAVVLAGAMVSLSSLTVMAAVGASIVTQMVPRNVIHRISALLFLLVGVKMLSEGLETDAKAGANECNQLEQELDKREKLQEQSDAEVRKERATLTMPPQGFSKERGTRSVTIDPQDSSNESCETKVLMNAEESKTFRKVICSGFYTGFAPCWYAFVQSMVLTFIAEWGDRTQLSTLMLAAEEHWGGVVAGGICGHFFSTSLAVLGGRVCAHRISVKHVTLLGGVVFICFGVAIVFLPS